MVLLWHLFVMIGKNYEEIMIYTLTHKVPARNCFSDVSNLSGTTLQEIVSQMYLISATTLQEIVFQVYLISQVQLCN